MKLAEIRFEVPDGWWQTSNHRSSHWAPKAAKTKNLLHTAYFQARAEGLTRAELPTPVRVIAWIGYPTAVLADPGNAEPTVKPRIDGLVKAGALPADDYRHPEPARRFTHTVHLTFHDVTPEEVAGP